MLGRPGDRPNDPGGVLRPTDRSAVGEYNWVELRVSGPDRTTVAGALSREWESGPLSSSPSMRARPVARAGGARSLSGRHTPGAGHQSSLRIGVPPVLHILIPRCVRTPAQHTNRSGTAASRNPERPVCSWWVRSPTSRHVWAWLHRGSTLPLCSLRCNSVTSLRCAKAQYSSGKISTAPGCRVSAFLGQKGV